MARAMVDRPLRELEAVRQAWNYPLFQAIFQRRARRFPIGAEMPEAALSFKSDKEPMPLAEIEEALLVMVATGLSGLILSDLPFSDTARSNLCGNTLVQFAGRTYASSCGSHGTELFFTNDEGTYMVKMRDKLPEKVVEYETQDDWEKIITTFRANTIKLLDGRLNLPLFTPVTLPFNTWNVNQPGTTVFMPISDISVEYLNLVLTYMDEPACFYFYDDLNGNAEPLKKWADRGKLNRRRAYSLSQFEMNLARNLPATEAAFMLQNMYLAAQAMGLGGWIFGALPGPVVMGGTPLTPGLGFRFHRPEKPGPLPRPDWAGPGLARPVGLDGLFEPYRPPYYRSMSDAVQAFYDTKWGAHGLFHEGPAAFRNREALDRIVPKPAEWVLEATKELCEYIWHTYDTFPAFVDVMQVGIWFQAHHLETDFYDKYYQPGAYPETVARHYDVWHGGMRPRVRGEQTVTA